MSRGNGGLVGVYNRYPGSGIWSLREAQLKAAIKIDYAVIGGGNSGGTGGACSFGSALVSRIAQTVTVGAINGSSNFLGVTANAGAGGSPTLRSSIWGEGSAYAYDGMPGGSPANNAGVSGYATWDYGAGGAGGNGNLWSIDGNYYGGGLGGSAWSGGSSPRGPIVIIQGTNGLGASNYGGGNRSGGVIASYLSNVPLFFGGTTTVVSGRVYHSFGSSGFLVPL